MASISASDVKKLRDLTGAGMMDCKKALAQADGDFAGAEKILKEMGLAAVAKRQDRATENGRVFVETDGKKVVMLSLSCETDFVAKNEDFGKLGKDLCASILKNGYTEPNDELKAMVKFTVTDIPENGYCATYVHGDGAVAVSVILTADNKAAFENDAVKEFAHDLALHCAAFKPQYLSESVVDKAYEEEQLAIFRAQVSQDEKLASKPEKVKEGIVRGKLSKLYKEICFLDQPFVKDDSKSVKEALAEVSKSCGAKLDIISYSVFMAGLK